MIRVLIVDDAPLTLANIQRLLDSEEGMETCGTASDAASSLQMVGQLGPDVVLIDMDLEGVDGNGIIRGIREARPATAVVAMGLEDDEATVQEATAAGATAYLVKPFGGEELLSSIRRVVSEAAQQLPQNGEVPAEPADDEAELPPAGRQVVAVLSGKGGVGTTVLATNLALLIAAEAKKPVALLDFDLQHSDTARLLRLDVTHSVMELVQHPEEMAHARLLSYTLTAPAGVRLLAPPQHPRLPIELPPDFVDALLRELRQLFDVVVIDIPAHLTAAAATALRAADRVIVVSGMSDPAVRATQHVQQILDSLHVGRERRLIVLNRTEANSDLSRSGVEGLLETQVAVQLPYDPILVSTSINRGAPFALQKPEAQVTRRLRELAGKIVLMPQVDTETAPDSDEAWLASGGEERRKKPRRGLFGFVRS